MLPRRILESGSPTSPAHFLTFSPARVRLAFLINPNTRQALSLLFLSAPVLSCPFLSALVTFKPGPSAVAKEPMLPCAHESELCIRATVRTDPVHFDYISSTKRGWG